MKSLLSLRAIAAWRELPASVRHEPASPDQIENFELRHGPLPPGFRDFLMVCGGGVIGSEWIDGIEQLEPSQAKFFTERAVAGGWKMEPALVIGWNGAGSPIAIDRDGVVVVEDHNDGEIHVLAASFEEFFEKGMGHAL